MPLGLPSEEGNDLYLTKSTPWEDHSRGDQVNFEKLKKNNWPWPKLVEAWRLVWILFLWFLTNCSALNSIGRLGGVRPRGVPSLCSRDKDFIKYLSFRDEETKGADKFKILTILMKVTDLVGMLQRHQTGCVVLRHPRYWRCQQPFQMLNLVEHVRANLEPCDRRRGPPGREGVHLPWRRI